MTTTGRAGQPVILSLEFFDEENGSLTDPDSVQLDITQNGQVGLVPDIAGPFSFSGASVPTPGQVWRTGVGQFSFAWQIPPATSSGVYVANWSIGFEGDTFLGPENFLVAGGVPVPVPSGDVGFWTGSIDYTPAPGNVAQLTPVSIPLGATDANGITWLLQKVEGWDGPDVQGGGVIPKSGDHGALAAPQFYAARNLTLTITASAATQALRDTARALLQQAIPISDLAQFTYNEPIPKTAMVRRSGKITEAPPTTVDVTFTCGLVAPDPRKYSAQVHTLQVNASDAALIGVTIPATVPFTLPDQQPGGIMQLTNSGTFESRPVITIDGPITSPSLTNVTTGQTVSWTSVAMGDGDVLVADFNLQQTALNGKFVPADLFSSWWTLPPGASTIQLGGTAGAGAGMSATWQDGFI